MVHQRQRRRRGGSLGDALGAEGERRPQVAATAKAWHGYCLGMSSGPAAGVLECGEAVAALRPAADPLRLVEALELWAAVLAFSNHFDQSLQALHEAKGCSTRSLTVAPGNARPGGRLGTSVPGPTGRR